MMGLTKRSVIRCCENNMDSLDFSEDEIQEQLAILGYKNIAKHRLQEFKRDLDELILHGKWQTRLNQLNSSSCHTAASQLSRPAYTKEKVSQCCIQSLDDGFTLHAGKVDLDRQVITTCQTRNHGWRQGHADSYAQHSVTTMLRPPPGAPAGLQVELEPEDPQHPPYADSHRSIPYTQRTRFIKRKVLRKHKGESLVCDESMYSEETGETDSLTELI
ncbi:hypothetical protein LDENG_00063030 [Lucifuga dentata]|nr:hypothetical protein LDENG_00063030 [Lucifuga dentata]